MIVRAGCRLKARPKPKENRTKGRKTQIHYVTHKRNYSLKCTFKGEGRTKSAKVGSNF